VSPPASQGCSPGPREQERGATRPFRRERPLLTLETYWPGGLLEMGWTEEKKSVGAPGVLVVGSPAPIEPFNSAHRIPSKCPPGGGQVHGEVNQQIWPTAG